MFSCSTWAVGTWRSMNVARGGTAAEGFEAEGAGAGEEVDGVAPSDSVLIRLKIASRTRCFIGRTIGIAVVAELAAAKVAADDSQLGLSAGVARARCRVDWRVVVCDSWGLS